MHRRSCWMGARPSSRDRISHRHRPPRPSPGARFAALAALSACALALAPAHAAPAPLAATRTTLANGLRVVLAPDSTATAADVAVWYPAGSRWEGPGQSGMAGVAERVMFRGSAHVADGEHRRRIVETGGMANTTVTPDYACFWQTVPGEQVGLALRLEADRMAALSAAPATVDEERRALARERAAAPPLTIVASGLAKLYATLFPGQAYGHALASSHAAPDAFTAPDFDAWRRARYAPGGAVITVCGRFDPAGTLALVRELFEGLPRGAAPPAAAATAPAAGARRSVARLETPAKLCFVGWRGPGAADPDEPAFELLAALLGGASDAALPRALVRDWNLAVAAQAGFTPLQQSSVLWTFAVARPGADSSAVERTLLDTATRVAREAPSAEEVERARRQLETSTLLALQTARARAQALGEAELLAGDAATAQRRLDALHRLGPADLQKAAGRLLAGDASGVVWVTPAAGGAR